MGLFDGALKNALNTPAFQKALNPSGTPVGPQTVQTVDNGGYSSTAYATPAQQTSAPPTVVSNPSPSGTYSSTATAAPAAIPNSAPAPPGGGLFSGAVNAVASSPAFQSAVNPATKNSAGVNAGELGAPWDQMFNKNQAVGL